MNKEKTEKLQNVDLYRNGGPAMKGDRKDPHEVQSPHRTSPSYPANQATWERYK